MAKKAPEILAQGQVKARVLSVCVYGVPNDVVALSSEDAGKAQADGSIDATPEAVAYAESLIAAEAAAAA